MFSYFIIPIIVVCFDCINKVIQRMFVLWFDPSDAKSCGSLLMYNFAQSIKSNSDLTKNPSQNSNNFPLKILLSNSWSKPADPNN